MTATTPSASPPPAPKSPPRKTSEYAESVRRGKARRDQVIAVAIGVALMVGAQLFYPLLTKRRAAMVKEDEASLATLAVNFPRLTLGGFRGLLSTTLWIQAENDKENRKWYDLETKYDMIATLQPYFVTVYTYHSWNQAYNLSAQWHDEDSKYKWVLDGLAYCYKGEIYNPNNPDLCIEEGNLFNLKLGISFERIFYRAHWRSDIARLYQLNNADLKPGDSTDALKIVNAVVQRPEFHAELLRDPSGRSNQRGFGIEVTDPVLFSKRNDGKKAGDPVKFQYGLSPFYFAYQEYMRTIANGPPTEPAARVLDFYPAMCLRLWCRDDVFYTANIMDDLFDRNDTAILNNPVALGNEMADVEDCYRNVQMIAPKGIEIYKAELLAYPQLESTHRKHVLETAYLQATAKAEQKLFDALINWQADGRKLTPRVRTGLLDAIPLYDDAIKKHAAWVNLIYPLIPGRPVDPMRADLNQYGDALAQRRSGIEAMLSTDPSVKPDMSFLAAGVVER